MANGIQIQNIRLRIEIDFVTHFKCVLYICTYNRLAVNKIQGQSEAALHWLVSSYIAM